MPSLRPKFLFVTLMRHGESTDNVKAIWAGHKDAPLTNHGFNQAKAAGEAFKDRPLHKVYCSDLKRAHWTAQQVLKANVALNASTSAREVVHPVLREQYFGEAEGLGWHDAAAARELGFTTDRRRFRFVHGESLDDVGARADLVVNAIIKPWLCVAQDSAEDLHILLVSHGIMIAELVRSFLLLNEPTSDVLGFGPLSNTAYHTFRFQLQPHASPLAPELIGIARSITSLEDFPASTPLETADLPIQVSVVSKRQEAHLATVKRQHGGIGSSAYDEKQQSIQAFFGGGGGLNPQKEPTSA